jgi:hypothetical protein
MTAKKTSKTKKTALAPKTKPLRFAHPFFTTTPKTKRKTIPGVGKGLSDYPSKAWLLEKIPAPNRDPTMTLDEIVGTAGLKQIQTAGSITFHSVGDTGSPDTMTEIISEAMATDYDIAHPETCPAFLLHLGDVIYYDNTDKGYLDQFYTPYMEIICNRITQLFLERGKGLCFKLTPLLYLKLSTCKIFY